VKEIKAYIRVDRLEAVLDALHAHPDLPGVTCSEVTGFGRARQPGPSGPVCTSMTKLEIVVDAAQANGVIRILLEHASTGRTGDGMVFVSPIDQALRIRMGLSDDS